MTYPEFLTLLPALSVAMIAGFVLGAFFFGGLWWTVRKCLTSSQPAFWLLGSLILRLSVVLGGFYYLVSHTFDGKWQPLLSCFIGFILARILVTRLADVSGKPVTEKTEASNAS